MERSPAALDRCRHAAENSHSWSWLDLAMDTLALVVLQQPRTSDVFVIICVV